MREINRKKPQTRNSHVCYGSVYNEDVLRLLTSLDFSRLVRDPSICNSTVTCSHPDASPYLTPPPMSTASAEPSQLSLSSYPKTSPSFPPHL